MEQWLARDQRSGQRSEHVQAHLSAWSPGMGRGRVPLSKSSAMLSAESEEQEIIATVSTDKNAL